MVTVVMAAMVSKQWRVEVLDLEIGVVVQRAERNAAGSFYQMFQRQRWVAQKKKEAAKEAAAAGAVSGA